MSSRRDFLKKSSLAAAGLFFAERIIADPYRPLPAAVPGRTSAIRVRGAVKSNGKGIPNVNITDGIQVIKTGGDGTFELITTNNREYVYMTTPGGYKLNINETGTANYYKKINANSSGEMDAVFNLGEVIDDNKHMFLQMADPQTQDQYEMDRYHNETVPDVQSVVKANAGTDMFLVSCGDIMFDNLEYYPQYEEAVKKMGIPGIQVMGNHDVEVQMKTDASSERTFKRHFGPNYYSFDRGEVHYVVLDDIFWFGGYIGYLEEDQINWLRQDLANVEHGKTVVVFCHIPVWSTIHSRYGSNRADNSVVIVNRELLYKILEPYKAYILSGHTHESEYLEDGGCEVHVNGAVCGAWWAGDICWDGTPNGYSIYTVEGSELKWQYKSTGRDLNHQMRLFKPGADKEKPDMFIANVWSADKHTEVTWYEDGERKGRMKQEQGLDPLTVEEQEGNKKPEHRPWVDPRPNIHMYYAKPKGSPKEITVEVKDRWGRTYSDKITM